MTAIGHHLKEARNKKGVSLEEAYALTKIHPHVLQSLEEDKFEKLPSPLFVKSFLKTYAEFLELDPREMIETYEKEKKKDPEQILFIKPAGTRETALDRARVSLAPIATFAGFLAVIAAALFLFKFAGGFLVKNIHLPTRAPRNAASLKPKAVSAKKESAVSEEWLRSPEARNFPKVDRKTPLRLEVKATDNVWLRVTCDGKVLFESTLKRGAVESWAADESIEIWTGNPSGMQLVLNNQPLGSLGKTIVKKMIVSREGIKKIA
ncbi:MAG: helix-turn-helix domain-containing protein [Candidatus Omnitrophica bacterium]|nr:helix-turn-helix domain-containing protein [Candidatus Omnitrophota bacterium]